MKAADRPLNLKMLNKPIFGIIFGVSISSIRRYQIRLCLIYGLIRQGVWNITNTSYSSIVYTHNMCVRMDPLPINRRGNIADCRDGDESKTTCSRSFIIPSLPITPQKTGYADPKTHYDGRRFYGYAFGNLDRDRNNNII